MSDLLQQLADKASGWLLGLFFRWGMSADWAHVTLNILAWILGAVWGIMVIMLAALVFIYLERKVAGYMQARLGPTRCGPAGIIQSFPDALKLLLKEDIIPRDADRLLHTLGPVTFLVASALAYAVIPWDLKRTAAGLMDANIGILYAAAVSSLAMAGIIMGGWGSNNKWSLLGAVRGAAQMVCYEVPLLLTLLCIAVQSETLSMAGIIENQHGGLLSWNLLRPWMWLPMLIFVISGIAEVNRTPFDLPEAESELVSGYHTEYTGMKFALYFLGEYGNVYLISLIFTVLFMGGWQSPLGNPDPLGIPGILWLLVKAFGFVLLLMWVRWTLPRLRMDQLMAMSWKLMIPAGFIALAIVTGVVLAGWA